MESWCCCMTHDYFPPRLQCFGSLRVATLSATQSATQAGRSTDREVALASAEEPCAAKPRPDGEFEDDAIDVSGDSLSVAHDVLSVDDDVLRVDR